MWCPELWFPIVFGALLWQHRTWRAAEPGPIRPRRYVDWDPKAFSREKDTLNFETLDIYTYHRLVQSTQLQGVRNAWVDRKRVWCLTEAVPRARFWSVRGQRHCRGRFVGIQSWEEKATNWLLPSHVHWIQRGGLRAGTDMGGQAVSSLKVTGRLCRNVKNWKMMKEHDVCVFLLARSSVTMPDLCLSSMDPKPEDSRTLQLATWASVRIAIALRHFRSAGIALNSGLWEVRKTAVCQWWCAMQSCQRAWRNLHRWLREAWATEMQWRKCSRRRHRETPDRIW